MATLAATCRMSSHAVIRQLRNNAPARTFRTATVCLAAQNFTMPALSPTMTEGNIATWKVKEGDSFSAGDVLLEVETDKAQMDVEAADDGIMAKIMQGDGSKAVAVGTRIAVIAAPDDDLSTLEIPSDDVPGPAQAKEEAKKGDSAKQSSLKTETPPASEASGSDAPTKAKKSSKAGGASKQTKPLLPSVEHLIHANGLSTADVDKMTPSGPNNRLLKGDVLAYLGSIAESYPTDLSTRLNKLTHLDLSNVRLAAPKQQARKNDDSPKAAPPEAPKAVAVAMPISMKAVLEVQKRIQATLGVHMPLETFIARATDYANESLPRSRTVAASADELFNAVLGLNKVSQAGTRGHFVPQITALQSGAGAKSTPSLTPRPQSDIIDILSGKKGTISRRPQKSGSPSVFNLPEVNVFSVSATIGEEKRARVFLERVRTVLEREPGMLVL